jgi:hypothetical protein
VPFAARGVLPHLRSLVVPCQYRNIIRAPFGHDARSVLAHPDPVAVSPRLEQENAVAVSDREPCRPQPGQYPDVLPRYPDPANQRRSDAAPGGVPYIAEPGAGFTGEVGVRPPVQDQPGEIVRGGFGAALVAFVAFLARAFDAAEIGKVAAPSAGPPFRPRPARSAPCRIRKRRPSATGSSRRRCRPCSGPGCHRRWRRCAGSCPLFQNR